MKNSLVMKKLLNCIVIIYLVSCNDNNSNLIKEDLQDTTLSVKVDSTSLMTTVNSDKFKNWKYSEEEDKMDSKKSFFADCYSSNTLHFNAPYEGGSSFKLRVQLMGGSTEVALYGSPCQFLTGIDNDKRIRIKFDEQKPFYITCGGASDGSSNVIFLYPTQKIISKLKTSSKVTIEPEFFEEGYQQVDFDVVGFTWKH